MARDSTIRLETALSSVHRRLDRITAIADGTDQSAFDKPANISRTHVKVSMHTRLALTSTDGEVSLQDGPSQTGRQRSSQGVDDPSRSSKDTARMASAPGDLLETSPNFFPETYTSSQYLPSGSIVAMSGRESVASATWRTNIYRVNYMLSPRQWRRLYISVDIGCKSPYWPVTKLSDRGCNSVDNDMTAAGVIPASMLTSISSLLSKMDWDEVQDEAELQVSVADDISLIAPQQAVAVRQSWAANSSRQTLADFFALDDMGLPRYFEKQVTQLGVVHQPNKFISCLDDGRLARLVMETKLSRSVPTIGYLYNIQVLRCMQNSPSFLDFVGVVTDDSGRNMKSFLVELPLGSRLLSDILHENNTIPWEQREIWARQLVEAISQLHGLRFVLWSMSMNLCPILVDGAGRLRLWQAANKFNMRTAGFDRYPPEFYRLYQSGHDIPQAQCPDVTPKDDIWFLGRTLWCIAHCWPSWEDVQALAQAYGRSGKPVVLLPLPPGVPEWYSDIIESCRAIDPQDRPAAWQLLERFPRAYNSSESSSSPPTDRDWDLTTLPTMQLAYTTCDRCRRYVSDIKFQCNICSAADFDLCAECLDKGRHCDVADHILVELRWDCFKRWETSGRYFSGVKPSGGRELIVV